MWLAGGGVKGGFSYGATDELGAQAVENKVHVHDCTRPSSPCSVSITRSSPTVTPAAIFVSRMSAEGL
jgi:hypothetical protein